MSTIADKLLTIAENDKKLYEAGRDIERDMFWDALQTKGNRTVYYETFFNFGSEVFYPKYNIKLSGSTGAYGTFRQFPMSAGTGALAKPFDLVARLNECGVTLDTSGVTGMYRTFHFSTVTTIPTLDLRNCTSPCEDTFYFCRFLHTIEKIILPSEANQAFYSTFGECSALENITFEGVIGNGFNMQWSTLLSRASIENIIGSLSTTASGRKITLSQTAVNNAFTTAEWTALVNTRPNWTIALA